VNILGKDQIQICSRTVKWRHESSTELRNHLIVNNGLNPGAITRHQGKSKALLTQYRSGPETEPEPRNIDEQTACNSETRHSG